jgi:MFS transporter, MHS family, alpha-ketoglutarate permease
MICLSLIIYSTMRDTKHESAMHLHEWDGVSYGR